MKRRFSSLYSGLQGLYAVATDGSAWRWSDRYQDWEKVAPLPDEPDPQPQEIYDENVR